MNLQTGDIIHFHSEKAGKGKFHLCLSIDRHFIFLNSPKKSSFLGDFDIPSGEIDGITPTSEGRSVASCSLVMEFTAQELANLNAKKVGKVSVAALTDLLVFVENLTTIPPETRDKIVDGLGDYIGI